MKKSDFLEGITKVFDIEGTEITEAANIKEFEEYDSLSLISLMAFIYQNFNRRLTAKEIYAVTTIENLMDLIGKDNFNPNSRIVYIYNTMDKVGFHLELFERPSSKVPDFTYTEIKEWWNGKT